MKTNSNTQAMETERIPQLLAQLAIPAVVAQIINLLYNIVDRIYIGHIPGVGASALTGVGLFTPILMLINAFAMLAGARGAPRAAISMGKKDNRTAEKILGNCFSLLIIMAVILTFIFFIFAPQMLTLFGASGKTLPYAVAYSRIYILGSIFVLIVMGMNPFITTQGFAKISMLTTVIGAVINIILDPIFIFVLDLGVRGAALATVLSQAVGAVWILRFLTGKKTILHQFHLQPFKVRWRPGSRSNDHHYQCVSQLVTMPVQGICQGGQPIISYNFGANNKKRVKEAFFTQFKACIFFTTLCWSVLLLACLRKLILLIPLIFILPLFLSDKVFAVFLAEPVSDILAAAITTITFLSRFNGILNQKDLACCKIFTNTD